MKKNILLFFALIFCISGFAQQSNVVSAFNYLKAYLSDKSPDDLRNAQKYIDEASTNESTAGKPKTWYYRGNIYLEISRSEIKNDYPDALQQAATSYSKVFDIDPEYENADESYNKCIAAYSNLGISQFNAKKYEESLVTFEKVVEITEKRGSLDKDALNNASMAALRAKNYAKVVTLTQRAIETAPDKTGEQYIQLEKAYLSMGDTLAFLNTLKKGRQKYPGNQSLLIDELSYMLAKGNSKDAEVLLKEAIAADPNNPSLYLAAGSTYEKLNKNKEALEAYQKAISIKPDSWEAYYNIGAYYVGEGKRLQDLANNEKDSKKYEAGSKLAEDELKKALPNLEKAREFVPAGNDKRDVLIALKQLYGRLKMDDKFQEVKKELEGK